MFFQAAQQVIKPTQPQPCEIHIRSQDSGIQIYQGHYIGRGVNEKMVVILTDPNFPGVHTEKEKQKEKSVSVMTIIDDYEQQR